MAVSYLFKWRAESRYIEPLLARLHELCLRSAVHYLPTVMYSQSYIDSSWVWMRISCSKDFAKGSHKPPFRIICLYGGRIPHISPSNNVKLRISWRSWTPHCCGETDRRRRSRWYNSEQSKKFYYLTTLITSIPFSKDYSRCRNVWSDMRKGSVTTSWVSTWQK